MSFPIKAILGITIIKVVVFIFSFGNIPFLLKTLNTNELNTDTNITVFSLLPGDAHGSAITTVRQWLGSKAFIELILFAAFLFAIGNKRVKRIHRLQETSHRIAKGELGFQIDDTEMDDVGAIATAFDKMSTQSKELNANLQLQNNRLKTSDQFKDDFLVNVVHELNTPVNEIIEASEALGDAIAREKTGLVQSSFDQVSAAAKHLLNIIDKTITFSHERHKSLHHNWKNISINEYFDALVKRFEYVAKAHDVKLKCQIETSVNLRSNLGLLDQVFTNIFASVIKSTNKADATLHVNVVEPKLLVITIANSENSLPQELDSQTFARFDSGLAGDSATLAGSELSLAIVKEALILLAGDIYIETSADNGNRVTVLLPLHDAVSRFDLLHLWRQTNDNAINPGVIDDTKPTTGVIQPPVVTVSSVDSEKKNHGINETLTKRLNNDKTTILVVDDDAINREALRANLQHQFNIIEADSGHSCLQLLSENRVDITLLDLMMPGMSGFDVLQHLRNKQINTANPIIVLSAKDQPEDIVGAYKLGAVDYVTKPFHPEILRARILIHVQLKQINEALRHEQEYIRNVFDSSMDMIISIDQHRNIITFNRAAEKTLGYTANEVYGQSIAIFYVDPSEARVVFDSVERDGQFIGEVINRRKNNTTFFAMLSSTTLYDNNVNVIGSVITARDITEQKKLETMRKEKEQALRYSEEMATINSELNAANEKLNKALDDMKKAKNVLVQNDAMASLGQLVAEVVHEINNPCNFIYQNIAPLKNSIEDIDNILEKIKNLDLADENSKAIQEIINDADYEFIKDDLGDIISTFTDGCERIINILVDLRKFSKDGDSKMKLNDINACIKSTTNLMRNTLTKRNIKCTFTSGIIPKVLSDSQQLNQVVLNLIVNGMHAMESDGTIEIVTYKKEKNVCISIKDSGCGIPEKIRDKIFEPFFTTKVVGEGTGLGLSISHGIIQQMNGDLTFTSIIDEGTEFIISLPIAGETLKVDA